MKILYITSYYPPDNVIAAVRSGKLCKYFAREENKVYIATFADNINSQEDEKNIIIIFNDKAKKLFNKMEIKKVYKDIWLKSYFLIFIRRFKNIAEMINIFIKASKDIKKIVNSEKPDAIIATYGPHYIIWMGIYGKYLFKKAKLVIDIRDPIISSHRSNHGKIDCLLQNAYIKFSDILIAVTPWIKKILYDSVKQKIKEKIDKKTFVITNGFDNEEWNEIKNVELLSNTDGKIHILAMGTFYKMSDASALFIAINELIKKDEIPRNKFVLHYAGNDFEKYKEQAKTYKLSDLLINNGNLNRKEILILERQCDILLLLSYNFKNEQDIYTGKLFEYMVIKRPILALVQGNLANSGIYKIISKCRIGYCFEYISKNCDGINSFIKNIYENIRSFNTSLYDFNDDEINKYSYKNLAHRYLNILKSK